MSEFRQRREEDRSQLIARIEDHMAADARWKERFEHEYNQGQESHRQTHGIFYGRIGSLEKANAQQKGWIMGAGATGGIVGWIISHLIR